MLLGVKSQTGQAEIKTPHMLFLGYGYVARALTEPLKNRGFKLSATVRSDETRALCKAHNIIPIEMKDLGDNMSDVTHMVISVPPGLNGDPVLNFFPNLSETFTSLTWAAYLSATSVYGNRKGQWVFEDELLFPTSQRGRNRVEAELSWLETGLPVHIFRLSGIYGPNVFGRARNPFERIHSGRARAVHVKNYKSNRIHADDIVKALMLSLERPNPQRIYNLADGHPEAPDKVLDFAADIMGAEPLKRTDLTDPHLSDMARSFYADYKCVSSDRACKELGWSPQFPSYKEGLRDIAKKDGWAKPQKGGW